MIVTHSTDRKLNLWDLNEGIYVASFPDNSYINTLCFNPDGSQLATVAYYPETNESLIKIWKPQLQQLLHTIKHRHHVYHLNFTQGASNNILTVFMQKPSDNREKMLTLWSLNGDTKPTLLGYTSPLPWTGEELTDIDAPYKKYYDSHFSGDGTSTLYITKKYCPELHLCKQAIENNLRPETLTKIRETQPYSRLTKYEKNMVDTHIIRKAAALLTLQQKQYPATAHYT